MSVQVNSNNFLRGTVPTTARPIMVSIWMRRNAGLVGSNENYLYSQAGAVGNNNFRREILLQPSTLTLSTFERRASGDNYYAHPSAGSESGVWRQSSHWWVGTSLREATYNGGNLGSGTNFIGTTSWDASAVFQIGRPINGVGDGISFAQYVAELSFWSGAGLTADERRALDAELAAGVDPLVLTADDEAPWHEKLLRYWTLDDADDLTDHVVGATLTKFGSPGSQASHPTIAGAAPPTAAVISASATDTCEITIVRVS